MAEFEPFIARAARRMWPARRRMIGDDAAEQEARLAVVMAARRWKPGEVEGGVFKAYAWVCVRQHLLTVSIRLGKSRDVWAGMPTNEEGWSPDPPDYRRPDGVHPALDLWHSPECVEQRQCLNALDRLALYLLTVEGLTAWEAAPYLGTTGPGALMRIDEVARKLARYREVRAGNLLKVKA